MSEQVINNSTSTIESTNQITEANSNLGSQFESNQNEVPQIENISIDKPKEETENSQIQIDNNSNENSLTLVQSSITQTSELFPTETKNNNENVLNSLGQSYDEHSQDNISNNTNNSNTNIQKTEETKESVSAQVNNLPQKEESEEIDPTLSALYSQIFEGPDDDSDVDLEKVGDLESLSDFEDDDDLEEKQQKKIKKIVNKKHKKKHKKRKKEESVESEPELSEEQTTKKRKSESSVSLQTLPPSIDAELDIRFKTEVLDKTKRKRRTSHSEEEILRESQEIIEKMRRAYEDDLRAFKAKEPAVHKILLLPEALTQLSKNHLQECLLENDVLNVMRQWLEPLPDGSLPNIKIRQGFLKILTKYRIRKHHLIESGIAKAVRFLSEHPQEIQSNKRLASQLLNDWARPLFDISANYSELNNSELEALQISQRKLRLSSGEIASPIKSITENIQDADLEAGQTQQQTSPKVRRLHAAIPEKSPMDFIIRPSPTLTTTPKKSGSSKPPTKKSRFEKMFHFAKEGHKKTRQRAMSISVTKGVIV